MFLCQPLLEVLAGRGIEDINAFLKVPSWNDLPDPFSIPPMEQATARVLGAIRNRERIAIFGDYDCDGVLGATSYAACLALSVRQPEHFCLIGMRTTVSVRQRFIVFRAPEPTCL